MRKSVIIAAAAGPGSLALFGRLVEPAAYADAELFQLAVKVRALQTDGFGNATDVSAFLADVVLEIDALESIARVAQRPL